MMLRCSSGIPTANSEGIQRDIQLNNSFYLYFEQVFAHIARHQYKKWDLLQVVHKETGITSLLSVLQLWTNIT